MNKGKKRKGGFLMMMGLLLTAAALFLTVRNIAEQRNAEIAAGWVVDELREEIPGYRKESRQTGPVIGANGSVAEVTVSGNGEPVYAAADGTENAWPVDNTGERVPAVRALDGSWRPWPTDESGRMRTEACDGTGKVIDWPVDEVGTPLAWPVDETGLPEKEVADGKGREFFWLGDAVGIGTDGNGEGTVYGNVVQLPADSAGRVAFDSAQKTGMVIWPADEKGNILPWLSGGENPIPWPTDGQGRAISAAKAALYRREALKAQTLKDIPDYERYPEMEMPVTKIRGEYYIGVLEIPGRKISLPVMTDWSYAKLKVSPCRYSGSVYSGDIVIAGHNYWRHFSKIKQMRTGEKLSFTDVDGNVFNYMVSEVQVLRPTAVKEMKSGNWDLTLFTCTSSGSSRFAVRCTLLNSVSAK